MGQKAKLGSTIALMLTLGACQTPVPEQSLEVNTARQRSLEDKYVYSNEPDRVGAAQFERGNYALAERYFRDAVERKQGDIDSWIGLGASYDQLKRFDLADRAYAQALAIDGESARLLNNMGYSMMLRGRFTEARSRFERALAIEPENVVVKNNLALLANVRVKYRR